MSNYFVKVDCAHKLYDKNKFTDKTRLFFLSIPLRSALAARLFIEIRSSSNLPATLPDQAAWWAENYNPSQSAQQFEALVSTYENSSGMTPVGSLKQFYSINTMPTEYE